MLMTNEALAARLAEVADLLELDPQANRYRITGYRDAAQLIRGLETPVTALLKRDGREGLEGLPGIGAGLAGSIDELLRTEHLGLLERLRERHGSEELFGELPGIGPVLAERIHRELGVETLPELEQALHEGRLRQVAGVGPTLERHIRETELLDVDREYRELAAAGRLRKLAPRRFNPAAIA